MREKGAVLRKSLGEIGHQTMEIDNGNNPQCPNVFGTLEIPTSLTMNESGSLTRSEVFYGATVVLFDWVNS
jgi:hypothetical protein